MKTVLKSLALIAILLATSMAAWGYVYFDTVDSDCEDDHGWGYGKSALCWGQAIKDEDHSYVTAYVYFYNWAFGHASAVATHGWAPSGNELIIAFAQGEMTSQPYGPCSYSAWVEADGNASFDGPSLGCSLGGLIEHVGGYQH